jgi:NAD(P)-dependent dehydrogenase (short-subunit alcohol dehydrogenase family)
MRLENQRAMITGAADGLGRAIARAFAMEGASVVIFDIDEAKAQALAEELTAAGRRAVAVCGSVTEVVDIERAFDRADEMFGGIDILVNNAGVSGVMPSLEVTDEFWRRVIEIDLTGVFMCSRAAGRRMVAQASGVVVNIASIFGELAAPERLAYCVAKAGVCMLTKVLATEWGSHGVRINAVAPGYVHTALVDDLAAKGRLNLAAVRKRAPLGRMGEPDEIAELCVFLASPQAAFITGQIYRIDGGWSAYGFI